MVKRRDLALAAAGAASFAVGLAWTEREAQATSCLCEGGDAVLEPADGSRNVPIDTKLWLADASDYGYYDSGELVLLDPDGNEVEIVVETVETTGQGMRVGIPTAPLDPSTLYQVWSCEGVLCETMLAEFETGVAGDDEPPSAPSVADVDRGALGNSGRVCGPTRWIELASNHRGILVVDLGDADLDPDRPSGRVTTATTENVFRVGTGLCQDLWPDSPNATITPRYAVFDLSGNFSGWRDGEPLSLPEATGCGCSAGTPRHGWALWLSLFALSARRRRRQ